MNMDELEDIFKEDSILDETPNNDNINPDINTSDDPFFDEPLGDNTELSVLDQLLKSKGIENAKITILDENEQEKEVNFYDLSRDEQLEILSTTTENTNEDLDTSEIDLINHLRSNNLSVEDFLAQYKESILAEVQTSDEVSYDIDAYDDQELFLLDLKNKFDLTDEELQIELEKELANKDLFDKKVTKLRSEYKQYEDQYNANLQLEAETKREEQYNDFANEMVTIATNVSDYHGVYLDDSEKNETLSYLLELDESGVSKFSKDLNDPNKLYEAAWYLRYGKEAFKALENAYEAEIIKLKKVDKPGVVVRNSEKKIENINDLHW